MGHYWSEMRGPLTELELKQERAWELTKALQRLPASRFTVSEIGLILKVGWSKVKSDYWDTECDTIIQIAKREGIDG